ncbi:MAG TPA: hypothetical protein VNT01_16770 [Symbiobacteriaceae bacterium]|nr:hypothetical protein [Symbiobacteriaceae bacterium]
MRRYLIVLVLMAILIGSLFRASEQTGVRLMNMFATIGIFLFGVVGTLALTRWQTSTGLKEVQAALKSLEPDWVITDWARQGGGRPDYLLVGPGGLVCICIDETPQSSWARFARSRIVRSRGRAEAAVGWLRQRLQGTPAPELPVSALLVLTRRRSEAEYSEGTTAVMNADRLAEHLRTWSGPVLLDEGARFKLTRRVRSEEG